ncbi:RING-type E3 ubiquitin transferase rad18 [Hyphodiscus hymeniophilus]|uniref:RING-type E3 ubiquitin transferase rad18 n=1 Tax=Hyphodiscus hymeniophilus TaxID=353542 RepID=A0A9P7AZ22_9HELO|nr:RING-type E3 ubiquitin transferase rad18 [Hyphodiscus hymeniophilus]
MEIAKKPYELERTGSPKRKRNDEKMEEHSSPVRKRTRAGTRAQQSSQQVVILDSEGDDGSDYAPAPKPAQIECPMCNDSFPTERAVEAHLDHCNGDPPSKKQRPRSTQTSLQPQPVSKANTKRPERLAALNYSMVKDNALRKKMIDMGISASGSRPSLEKRYTEWVTLWNANCDSKTPKGSRELKRELDVWERTQGVGAPMASRMNPGGNIRDKDFDGLAWSRSNDDAFKDLVAQARKKRAVKTAEEPQNPATSEQSTSSVHNPSYIPQLVIPAHQKPPNENGPPSVGANISLNTSHMPEDPRNDVIPPLPHRTSSQNRYFQDGPPPLEPSFEPSSSQHPSAQILEIDNGISSDIATLRPLQP